MVTAISLKHILGNFLFSHTDAAIHSFSFFVVIKEKAEKEREHSSPTHEKLK